MPTNRRHETNERFLSSDGAGTPDQKPPRPVPLCIFGPGGDFRWGYTPQLAPPKTTCPGRGESRGSAGGGGTT